MARSNSSSPRLNRLRALSYIGVIYLAVYLLRDFSRPENSVAGPAALVALLIVFAALEIVRLELADLRREVSEVRQMGLVSDANKSSD